MTKLLKQTLIIKVLENIPAGGGGGGRGGWHIVLKQFKRNEVSPFQHFSWNVLEQSNTPTVCILISLPNLVLDCKFLQNSIA